MKKNIILDPWQEKILATKGNKLLCTGRQVGKTTIFARMAGTRMVKEKDSRIIVVSLTEDQAKLIIVMILDYLEKNYPNLICKGTKKPTQNKIYLRNGSQVIARPVGNTGDALRGFTGDVLIIDEASRMPELVWEASKPTLLTTAGEIWMCSTPHGKQGYFWEAFQNKNNRFTVFHISSEEVIHKRPISEGWSVRQREQAIAFLEQEKQEMSEMQYGQEYLGLFLDELRRYFPDKLIDSVEKVKRPEQIKKGADYAMGVDIARMGEDTSTFQIVRRINEDILEQVENIVTRKTYTYETEDKIRELDKIYKFKKVYLDAGAGTLGVSVLDHLKREFGNRIEAINNRSISLDKYDQKKQRLVKEDLYDNLRSLMEKGNIRLLDDEDLLLSLRSIQYEFIKTPSGITKMKIFANPHTATDIVEGLARSAWFVKEKVLNVSIMYI